VCRVTVGPAPRTRSSRGSRSARPGCGASGAAVPGVAFLADDGEQAAQFGQGVAAAVGDDAQGLGAALRFRLGEPGGAVGEADDDGEGVAEDVVHLPGDPGAFGGGGEAGPLVALHLQRTARSCRALMYAFTTRPTRPAAATAAMRADCTIASTGVCRNCSFGWPAPRTTTPTVVCAMAIPRQTASWAGLTLRPTLSSATIRAASAPVSASRVRATAETAEVRAKTRTGRVPATAAGHRTRRSAPAAPVRRRCRSPRCTAGMPRRGAEQRHPPAPDLGVSQVRLPRPDEPLHDRDVRIRLVPPAGSRA
jgi:hypothetical protein